VDGYVRGDVADYQMAAFAMAVFFKGMSAGETAALTMAMMRSGDVFEHPPGPVVVDKHSTGGIGDKVSLILAPLVACAGCRVPMVSGRGLGITGGTLDKLESIPGFRVEIRMDEAAEILADLSVVMMGQTDRFCPADKKLYALRDVTGTVESIPLITASILSKKLAAGLEGLVMDVKTGHGAFMTGFDPAVTFFKAALTKGTRRQVDHARLGAAGGQYLALFESVHEGACDLAESVVITQGHLFGDHRLGRKVLGHISAPHKVRC
jgi:pyrimidine-nucleoside phosphorylase